MKLKAPHNDEIWPGSCCNFPAWPPQQQLTACLVSSLRSYAAGKGPRDEIIAEKTDGLLSDPPSSEGLRIHPLPQGQERASLPVAPAYLLFVRGQPCHRGPTPASQKLYTPEQWDVFGFPSILDRTPLSQENLLEWAHFPSPFLERKRGEVGSGGQGVYPRSLPFKEPQEREGS